MFTLGIIGALLIAETPVDTSSTASAQQTVATSSASQTGGELEVRSEIVLEPDNRSTCVVPTAGNARVQLNLEGLKWDKWPKLCKKFAQFLRGSDGVLDP